MITHYHYRNGKLAKILLVFEESVEVVPTAPVVQLEQPVVSAVEPVLEETAPELPSSPQEPLVACEALPPPTKPQRAKMGVIRTAKTLVFTVGGEATVYVINNYTQLSLPPGVGLAVGAAAYGLNKYLKPESGGIL
jgi:hypothetical protein